MHRWSLKKLNKDYLQAAAIVASWPINTPELFADPECEVAWFRGTMVWICDAAMPRVKQVNYRAEYWWSSEIAQLRESCLRTRRQYTRTRRRKPVTPEETSRDYEVYRGATEALQAAISKAKARSWRELLDGLDRDPWGRPYRMVMGKLRPWMPPLTETLDTDVLRGVINTLFPVIRSHSPLLYFPLAWSDELCVTELEMEQVVRRLSARSTAPGPDGIPGKAWVLALPALGGRLRILFNNCLRSAKFPTAWKEANLVLLKKKSINQGAPSSYRPICLLDDVGKLFERIIANRINEHLSCDGPNISDNQFGFRQGRSTIEAILRVRFLTMTAASQGRISLAVSLDIVNAFNSIPWDTIRESLIYHQVPVYLQAIIRSYLRDRYILYTNQEGYRIRRRMYCGIPQGSVLGPLLWNLAYDAVLRMVLPRDVEVICYADDTLVLASGPTFEDTKRLAEIGVAMIITKICELGLRIAAHKTEALWFHKLPRNREPPDSYVRVGDHQVHVGRHMKYLGLTLDSRWGFEEHFDRLVPRIDKVVGALHRLLPNLGGPTEEVRLLYAGVVRSMILYGAPVWSHRLSIRRCRTKIYSLQRRVAIRIVRGYRTISYEAATLLACFPPLDILASMNARIYNTIREIAGCSPLSTLDIRRRENNVVFQTWRTRLCEERYTRKRVVQAILPSFEAWMRRKRRVTYRLTQIITGHGCFGDYLFKIGRQTAAICIHCDKDTDSAQHTLETCPAWDTERRALVQEVGRNLSLPVVIRAMLAKESAWTAVVTFCETVMSQKEAAGRNRERADPSLQRRQGCRGRVLANRPGLPN